MATLNYTMEMGTPDSSPDMAISLLRQCPFRAIEYRGDAGAEQIGMASRFRLANVDWPGGEKRVALVCDVEIDQAANESLGPQLLDGGIQLYVGCYPLKWGILELPVHKPVEFQEVTEPPVAEVQTFEASPAEVPVAEVIEEKV